MPDLSTPAENESVKTAPSDEAGIGSTTDNGVPAPNDRNSLTLGADGRSCCTTCTS